MITNAQSYVEGLLKEIITLKEKGKHGLYRINANISDEVASYVRVYFNKMTRYNLELKKCALCKNEWDIIINF